MANLVVEVSGICNMKCPICAYPTLTRPHGFMKLDLWKKIIDDCVQNGHSIHWIHYFGEPLLWPHLIEGIKYLISKGLNTNISTNGLLLSPKMVDDLYNAGQHEIMVALDTTNPDVYNKIRGEGFYQIVFNNIKQAITMQKLKIIVQWMPTVLNYGETEEDFYRVLTRSPYLAVCKWFNIRMTENTLNVSNYHHKPDNIDKSKCNKLYEYCVVLWDGRTVLCCFGMNGEMATGNLNSNTINESYNGTIANSLRSMIRGNDLPLICKRCFADHMLMT